MFDFDCFGEIKLREDKLIMTKADIIENVYVKTGISKKDSADLVELVFEVMKRILENGDNLKISGFGSFVVKKKADRKGRNPQTGESMIISARRILTFKSSSLLRQAINSDS